MKQSIEALTEGKLWFVDSDKLIVVPSNFMRSRPMELLSRNHSALLNRQPELGELDRFRTILCLEDGPTEANGDLRGRSFWGSPNAVSSLGVIFPQLRELITNFETFQGILYPDTIKLDRKAIEDPFRPTVKGWLDALRRKRVLNLSSILSEEKQARILISLLKPPKKTFRLGIWGLGDIGATVANAFRCSDMEISGISEIFIGGSRDAGKIEYEGMELEDMNIEGKRQPEVHQVLPGKEETYFRECDIILILISSGVTNPQRNQASASDVRSEQYTGNLAIISELVKKARGVDYDGQILVASDPVEQLTMGMYKVMRETGIDVNTHQFAGFGAMVNRSRAKAIAQKMGLIHFPAEGRTFGPHGKMMVAFPVKANLYNKRQAETLSILTGHRNYFARERKEKPHKAPAFLIVEGITRIASGGILYASPFIPHGDSIGAFFGTRVSGDQGSGIMTPDVGHPYFFEEMTILKEAYRWIQITSHYPETLREDPFKGIPLQPYEHSDMQLPAKHPAFHSQLMREWQERTGELIDLHA